MKTIIKAEPIKLSVKGKFKAATAAFQGGITKPSVKNLPRTLRTGQSRRQGQGKQDRSSEVRNYGKIYS